MAEDAIDAAVAEAIRLYPTNLTDADLDADLAEAEKTAAGLQESLDEAIDEVSVLSAEKRRRVKEAGATRDR